MVGSSKVNTQVLKGSWASSRQGKHAGAVEQHALETSSLRETLEQWQSEHAEVGGMHVGYHPWVESGIVPYMKTHQKSTIKMAPWDEGNIYLHFTRSCQLCNDSMSFLKWRCDTSPKTNMTMENPPFEDVFPIKHGVFPMSC